MTNEPQPSLWDQSLLDDPHARADKARRVMAMFDAIAPTYERVNRVLSLGRDATWRKKLAALAGLRPCERVLDLACGTGDVTRALGAACDSLANLVGADFSQEMLRQAASPSKDQKSIIQNQKCPPCWLRADAEHLPLADVSLDVITIAFGFRNLQNPSAGLGEMFRVLRPAGRVLILEFDLPRRANLRRLYLGYFTHVLPRLAAWISGDRTGAYDYLPKSVLTFLKEDQIVGLMQEVGFADIQVTPLTFGVAKIYLGHKP